MNASKRILALRKEKKELLLAMVDDDHDAIAYISPFVDLTDGVKFVFSTVDAEEMLNFVKVNKVHILLLDMEMPKMDGMQFLMQLQYLIKTLPHIAHLQVIVCSAHPEFAVDSFRYNVLDYLTKPVTFARYLEAIHKAKEYFLNIGVGVSEADDECITVVLPKGGIRKIPCREIIYVEARLSHTWVWIGATQYVEINEKFSTFLLRLPKSNFIQVHRSYAISLAHFRGMEEGVDILLDGMDKPVRYARRGGYKLFEEWLAKNVVRGKIVGG